MRVFIDKFSAFYRYVFVGVFVTFLDLFVLYLLKNYLNIEVITASTISFVIANITSFVLNKFWTFQNRNKNIIRQYVKFLIISLIGLTLTIFFMWLFYVKLNLFSQIYENNYLICKLLTSGIVVIWNFLGNKFWTFSKVLKLNVKSFKGKDSKKYKCFLSIVIPAYNESKRIETTLNSIINYLKKKNFTWEIIVVDDGSKDNTHNIIKKLFSNKNKIRVIYNPVNHGKGYSIKMGVLNASGKYILFTDADNSTPIEELDKFLDLLDERTVLIGSRYTNTEDVIIKKQPLYRRIISRMGNYLIKLFLLLDIEDTQCGFKIFPSKIAFYIFSLQTINRFGFDMEILLISKLFGLHIKEIPVNWFNSRFSRVRPIRDALVTFKDLIRIKVNLWTSYYNKKLKKIL